MMDRIDINRPYISVQREQYLVRLKNNKFVLPLESAPRWESRPCELPSHLCPDTSPQYWSDRGGRSDWELPQPFPPLPGPPPRAPVYTEWQYLLDKLITSPCLMLQLEEILLSSHSLTAPAVVETFWTDSGDSLSSSSSSIGVSELSITSSTGWHLKTSLRSFTTFLKERN